MSPFARALALLAGVTAAAAVGRGQDALPPETKAIISKLKDESRSKSPTTRASAYRSMGELGRSSGDTLRRALCEGMLDKSVAVRTAAADALKKIDEPLYKDAMAIYINKDVRVVAGAAAAGRRAEPLVPLVLPMVAALSPLASVPEAKLSPFSGAGVSSLARDQLAICMGTLVAIGPDDEVVNKAVVSLLANGQAENRAAAVALVGRVKNRKLALPTLTAMAVNGKELPATRAAAVRLLPDVADENTRPRARAAAQAVRLDTNPLVREAAEAALRRFGESRE